MQFFHFLFLMMLFASCKSDKALLAEIQPAIFLVKNNQGAFAKVTNYGGIIMELHVPTKDEGLRDVVLGFDQVEDYYQAHPYFGAIIGRYGNRIANGRFEIEGKKYRLPQNNGSNTLHGGLKAFDKQLWEVKEEQSNFIILGHTSPDGAEGFPGKLDVEVKYEMTKDNELVIEYKATTDQTTIVNLTNHSYFNLNGTGNGNILNHRLQIEADQFNAVDSILIPDGAPMDVEGTPFDFRKSTRIGDRIEEDHQQIAYGNGYDHNYVLNDQDGILSKVGSVKSGDGQVTMDVLTTEPGVQLYTGNFLDIAKGKGGKSYGKHSGFCLETQHYPNSPNRPDFPSTILRPGDVYSSKTVYAFF